MVTHGYPTSHTSIPPLEAVSFDDNFDYGEAVPIDAFYLSDNIVSDNRLPTYTQVMLTQAGVEDYVQEQSDRIPRFSEMPVNEINNQSTNHPLVKTDSFVFGDTILYSCYRGYILNSSLPDSVKCDYNGQWTKPLPSCEPITCSPPPQM